MSQRFLTIKTPLPGEDKFIVYRISGQERLGQLFTYELDLYSKDGIIKPADLLGQRATVRIDRNPGDARFCDGYISRVQQFEPHLDWNRFRITLVPWLWFLTRTSDCRIFQNKTVPEIVKEVFKNQNYMKVQKFEEHLSGKYRKREYCVQSRETDFNFVSRLMEDEGIYYFFTHKEGEHTLVLADSPGAHDPAGLEADQLPYNPASESQIRGERIAEWSLEKEVRTDAAAVNDYDFKAPRNPLLSRAIEASEYKAPPSEFYDYPGAFTKNADGEKIAGTRLGEFQSQYDTRRGTTDAPGLQPGTTVMLTDHPRRDQNQKYLIIGTSFSASSLLPESMGSIGGDEYNCSFDCTPIGLQWRPPRHTPVPFVRGPQTATVVGPKGEEIYTDEYGRIKVQFHWDREGKKNESSSCWVRVATPWAGNQWGMIHIPRIGQEVVVSFLEGDPDQPIIIGSVYNADQMPPYTLPADKTQSGIKSRSTLGGNPETFNEICFEDKKGSELVYIRAEKDLTSAVENDHAHWVGHDRTKTVDHDETTEIGHDRTETVKNNETITVMGNRTEKVMKNEDITIMSNRTEKVMQNEDITIAGKRTEKVAMSEDVTIIGPRSETCAATDSLKVAATKTTTVGGTNSTTVGGSNSTTVGGAHSVTVGGVSSETCGGPMTKTSGAVISITAGGAVVITASAIVMNAAAVTINSPAVIIGGRVVLPLAPIPIP